MFLSFHDSFARSLSRITGAKLKSKAHWSKIVAFMDVYWVLFVLTLESLFKDLDIF